MKLPERLLVGLSGGADSVALLLMLIDRGAQVSAVHVNHGLRGAEADDDESFVRELCRCRNIPLLVYRAVPPQNAGEGWAREARYAFFRQALRESRADALVLAHHRDDQAETLLLHLLRGAGLTGLTGMAEDIVIDGMRILRPLLGCSREMLRAYLKERQQEWREDASNADPRYLRNALRTEVLPLLEQLHPGAAQRMANTASLLAQDEAVLNELVTQFLTAHPGDALPLAPLLAQPLGLQKRILRAWWAAEAAPEGERTLSSAQTDAFHSLLKGSASARCNLPGGWYGQMGWTHVHLISPQKPAGMAEIAAEACPLLLTEPFAGLSGDGRESQAIPRTWLQECTVRSRRQGDFIRPFGSAGKQSLQDYLVNRHIDAAFRDRIPLLCRGSEVLLAGGVGAGAVPHTKDIPDPVFLRWTIQFPWLQGQNSVGGAPHD